jgi:hypothetical protein
MEKKKGSGFWRPFFGFLGKPHVWLSIMLGILVTLGILNTNEIVSIIQAIGDVIRGK